MKIRHTSALEQINLMAPNLLLVDALNMIRRIHAAIPSNNAQSDENTKVDHTLSASVASIQRAIDDIRPSHMLIVFDGDPPTWRHHLLAKYKAKRKPMPHAMLHRLVEFNDAFRKMGVMTFRRNGIEADDVIATTTHKAIHVNIKTTIISTDKAFRQLLSSPVITQRDHFKKINFESASVKTEYDIHPEQLPDYWGIAGIGDIPGVQGVGKKGAIELLRKFGSLNKLFEHTEDYNSARNSVLKKVLSQRKQAELSAQLARLLDNVEVGLSLRDLRIRCKQTP